MGGGVSWRYALSHHNKVKALILIDAVGLPEWQHAAGKKNTPLVFKLIAQYGQADRCKTGFLLPGEMGSRSCLQQFSSGD